MGHLIPTLADQNPISPGPQADGHDAPGLVHELVPDVAALIEDGLV